MLRVTRYICYVCEISLFFPLCFVVVVFVFSFFLFYIRCELGGILYICECKFVYMSEGGGVEEKVCVIVKCKRKYARYSMQ